MSRELLASQKNNSGILLDPRTKLAVLITIAVFILGGSYEGIMQYYIIVLAAIPLLLLSAARKWKGAVFYILIFGGSLCLEMFGLSRLAGVANYIAVAIVGILLRFTPSVVMGYFVVTTTTVSEFVAAMERLHLPQQITIPMSVMFRFFPTVAEEWSAIGDAMRMRGVRFGGGKVGAILEYRIVPMMICSVKIGEELSQAALTRGLGGPVKRTNICKLGFHVQDVIFLLICLGAFAAQIYVLVSYTHLSEVRMNKAMKYLTPKKPISKIARDRAEEMEERNVDLYEAIAGLFEELAALEQSNAELKARVEMLEKGGKQK